MTPLESELLPRLGRDYWNTVITLSIYGFFYGVFVILFSASIVIFVFVFFFRQAAFSQQDLIPKLNRRRGFTSRPTAAMFVATTINFLLSSLFIGSQVAILIVSIRKALILDIDYPLSEKPELINNALRSVHTAVYWASTLSVLFGDLIVIWRAWALSPDRKWMVLVPFILWIGGAGITVGAAIWISTPTRYGHLSSNVEYFLTAAVIVLSVATNAITTMVIAYKLWSHRIFIVKNGLSGRKSPVQTILILLVESGLVFLGFQIVFLVFGANNSIPDFKTLGFEAVYLSLSAMYPTAIIVLIETQRSIMDVCEINPSNASNPGGPVASEARPENLGRLSFAVGPVHSTTDDETESQLSRVFRSQGGQEHS